jgi:uncharacterized paraquat-inducible protein A
MMFGLDRVEGELEVYRKTRSIVGAVEELARTGNPLVAVLIATFSLVIPLFKLMLQLSWSPWRPDPTRCDTASAGSPQRSASGRWPTCSSWP